MRTAIIMMLSLVSFVKASALSSETNYGLYFNADQSFGNERTQLYLNDGNPVKFDHELTLDFDMMIRQQGTTVGSIVHVALDNGQVVRLLYTVDENNIIRPALMYNNALTYITTSDVKKGNWFDVSMTIVADKNHVNLHYAEVDTTIVVPVNNAKSATITMGRYENYNSDIMPMNVRDIRVSVDGTLNFYWKLRRHNDNVCLDSINRAVAKASYPKWLIDNHREWNLVYTDTIKGNVDMAFDCRVARTYIIRDKGIDVIDEDGSRVTTWPTKGESHIESSSGHAVFDPVTEDIVLYSLSLGQTKRFSTKTLEWTIDTNESFDPFHYNHTRAFNPADSSFYFFGGYGHYSYRNDLYKLSAVSGKIERVEYANPIPPRFGAAMTAIDNKLYVLGGRGNEVGKQVLETYFYYDLWEIDLKTLKARKIWSCQRPKDGHGWMMASSMVTLPGDDAIYALNMDYDGGTLIKYSLTDTAFMEVSSPIFNTISYQDFDFSLHYSTEVGKFFLIIHKITVNKLHTISIYSLNTPLLHDDDLNQIDENDSSAEIPLWILIVVGIVVVIALIYWFRTRKNGAIPTKIKEATGDSAEIEVEQRQEQLQTEDADHDDASVVATDEPPVVVEVDDLIPVEPVKRYYDSSKSSIVLIGGFSVRDKDGNDITISFTPKLKEFLLLMILSSAKSDRGIPVSKVTEAIWCDKEGSSARNNRNVTVRKLRMILESIGDIELTNQGGFMKISIPESVYCDYNELLRCAALLGDRSYSEVELYDRVLEILLGGALLPNSPFAWLDDYKSSYSSLSIDLLTNLLHKSIENHDDKMVLRIVRVMFVHDPLSEEALSAYCRTLVAQGKRGIAKKVYDRFCREFFATMGEPFAFQFNDVLVGRNEEK